MSDEVVKQASCGMETMVSNARNAAEVADVHVSVLFADVSGSARLYEKLGSAEALRAVDRCMKRMERAVEGFGGRIVKLVGDELMAIFALADEAFQAGIEMQLRVADLPPVSGVKLAVRVGFSHGRVNDTDGVLDGETVAIAACLAGLAKPGQVLTCVQALAALSPVFKKSTRDLGPCVAKGKYLGRRMFEAMPPEILSSVAKIPESTNVYGADGSQVQYLCLRYMGRKIILNDRKPLIRMGRDNESDAIVHDRRASRHHAVIEWRGGKIILVDRSTNGTFVTLSGQPELLLRKGECVLHGRGLICFASSANSPDADCAEFELL